MSHSLRETLKMTISSLRPIRRALLAAGQIEAMHDIDTLLHITQTEAERKLANQERVSLRLKHIQH
jgi:hypothetical protein